MSITRVLFVNGCFSELNVFEPLGICILASILREKGYKKVGVYDPCVEGDDINQAVLKSLEFKPDILAVSVTWSDSLDINKFTAEYRAKNKDSIIVLGGHGASLCPDRFLTNDVNAVIIGEAEISFPMFVEAIENKKSIKDVPGIYCIDDTGRLYTSKLPDRVSDINTLPFMARDTLDARMNIFGNNIYAQIMGSRDCYLNCYYCSIKSFERLQGGKIYRERNIDSIIEEMKHLYNNHSVRKFNFLDVNFLPPGNQQSMSKIDELCKKIVNNNMNDIKIHIECRPDSLNLDMIKKLMSVGLIGMFIGVESINKEDLVLYGRKSDPDAILRVISMLESIGFSGNINSPHRFKIGYIMFNPYSTRELLKKSLAFLRRTQITPKKSLSRLEPIYGTEIYDILHRDNLILPNNTSKFIDNDIAELYNYISDIIYHIMSFREKIRMPLKMHRELKSLPFDAYLDDLRIKLDNISYDAFEEILETDVKDFPALKDKFYSLISSMHLEDVTDKINVEEKYGSNDEAKKQFRLV